MYTLFYKNLITYFIQIFFRMGKNCLRFLILKHNLHIQLKHLFKRTLNIITIKFIIPSREHPVSSPQIPNVPPKLAILSVIVVRTSSLFISTSDLLYSSLTIMVFSIILCASLKNDECLLSPFTL